MKKTVISMLASGVMVFGVAAVASAADTATTDATNSMTKGEFGNHDAWSLAKGDAKPAVTDCKVTWMDTTSNKTYCFSSEANKDAFAKDTKTNIAKANAAYEKVAKNTTETSATTDDHMTH